MRDIRWQSDAWNEYLDFQLDKANLKKINSLIKDIQRNGFACSAGKPEMLVGEFSGYASVRINKKDRMIFSVTDDTVYIVQCKNHYLDK